jgi:hypothetical protein
MIQHQIIKLQEVLASQPLLQIDQRVQMQRQVHPRPVVRQLLLLV